MKRKSKSYWSGEVTKHSYALDLEEGVFTWKDPKRIAKSLKKSAEESCRRKTTPFQSAMSMLNFYINRAGKNLPLKQKRILDKAKVELRKSFNHNRFSKKAFTLIEFLVVIAIIGLLTSIVIVFLGPEKEKARDANRMTSMRQFQKMLELYVTNEGSYPLSTEDYEISGQPWGSYWEGYGTLPQDPLSSQSYAYLSEDGSSFELFSRFEREPINPSFDCGGPCGPDDEYNAKLDSLSAGEPVEEEPPEVWCQDGYGANSTMTIEGDLVYCDNSNRMWTPTADIGGSATTYEWGGYGTNEPTDSCVGVVERPACNYCDNLSYASFENWQLPSSNRLYQFGIDACGSYPCQPAWDPNAQADRYWSSIEYSGYNAWYVSLASGYTNYYYKYSYYYVRCVRE